VSPISRGFQPRLFYLDTLIKLLLLLVNLVVLFSNFYVFDLIYFIVVQCVLPGNASNTNFMECLYVIPILYFDQNNS